MNKRKAASKVLEDFSLESVPLTQRKTWINLAVIWIGIAVVMSAIFRGMMIGLGLGKISSVVISYVLGEIILIVMMGLTGYIGAKTGFSTPLLANFSFGTRQLFLLEPSNSILRRISRFLSSRFYAEL
jgi:cytosine permease